LGNLAGSLPPSFHDPCLVSVALEVFVWAVEGDEGAGEEFEADFFCPPDVAALRVPVSCEDPRTPYVLPS
jgi:hypothetical protein